MRRDGGRVSANTTTSATSSDRIILSSNGMPGVRRPLSMPKFVATPPGQMLVQRMPKPRSSWSSERVKPTCANFDAT